MTILVPRRFAAQVEAVRLSIDGVPDAFAGDDLIFEEEDRVGQGPWLAP